MEPFPPIMGTRGDRLRIAREHHFKSARAAAKALGIPPATYGAHERAQAPGGRGRDYGPEEAAIYGARFGVRPEWLLTGIRALEVRADDKATHQANPTDIFSQVIKSLPLDDPSLLERLRAGPNAFDAKLLEILEIIDRSVEKEIEQFAKLQGFVRGLVFPLLLAHAFGEEGFGSLFVADLMKRAASTRTPLPSRLSSVPLLSDKLNSSDKLTDNGTTIAQFIAAIVQLASDEKSAKLNLAAHSRPRSKRQASG